MGNNSSTGGLAGALDRAATRAGHFAISGRFHRLPKRLADDYEQDQAVLGTGYNGDVHRATCKRTGATYAVKSFKLHGVTAEKKGELCTECEIFLMLDHPHVARLVDVYEDEKHLNLVMECMTGGELFDRVKARRVFTEKDASVAMRQMLLSINYIHCNQVVHRDLKLENFLYESTTSDHLKLIDFGFSKIWEPNTRMALSCGTLAYVAPEVLDGSYDSQCDMWSLGVIAFVLLSGYMPFKGSERAQVNSILGGRVNWRQDKWRNVGSQGCDFVKALLVTDPLVRLTAEQALQHEFITMYEVVAADSASHFDNSMAEALCEFAKASQFRKACMSMMAWSLTNEERAQVREAFMEVDTSKQGTITLLELKNVLTTRFTLTDEAIKPIFAALDTSCDETIHYSEFLAAMVSTRIALHDDLLMTTFRRFDVDSSGFITIDNLREVLGKTHSGQELEDLLKEADMSEDGQISYDEFITYLKEGGSHKHNDAAVKIIEAELQEVPNSHERRPLSERHLDEDGEDGLELPMARPAAMESLVPASGAGAAATSRDSTMVHKSSTEEPRGVARSGNGDDERPKSSYCEIM